MASGIIAEFRINRASEFHCIDAERKGATKQVMQKDNILDHGVPRILVISTPERRIASYISHFDIPNVGLPRFWGIADW